MLLNNSQNTVKYYNGSFFFQVGYNSSENRFRQEDFSSLSGILFSGMSCLFINHYIHSHHIEVTSEILYTHRHIKLKLYHQVNCSTTAWSQTFGLVIDCSRILQSLQGKCLTSNVHINIFPCASAEPACPQQRKCRSSILLAFGHCLSTKQLSCYTTKVQI